MTDAQYRLQREYSMDFENRLCYTENNLTDIGGLKE